MSANQTYKNIAKMLASSVDIYLLIYGQRGRLYYILVNAQPFKNDEASQKKVKRKETTVETVTDRWDAWNTTPSVRKLQSLFY